MCIARPGRDHRQLVEADTEMPVGHRARQRRRHLARGQARIDDDKVVAQPVHFHEGQTDICSIRHVAPYSAGYAVNPAHPQECLILGLTAPMRFSR